MESFFQLLLSLTEQWGYFGIFALMVVESSFIPFPSELVIPPAAYLAHQGVFNIYLVILFGVLGSLVGALINYFLAFKLGRPLIYSFANRGFAKYLLINEIKLKKSEHYFLKYGSVSTFIGRLIPAVRQLISLPAGFVRMPLRPFIGFTLLGAGLWVTILALQGYLVGMYKDFFVLYFTEILLGVILFVVIGYLLFRFIKRFK